MSNHSVPEQGGFNERLGDIINDLAVNEQSLTDAFVAGHKSHKQYGIEDDFYQQQAKAAIRTLVLEEIIGNNQPMPKRGDVDPDIYIEVIHRVEGCNALRAEQRKKLGGTHGTK